MFSERPDTVYKTHTAWVGFENALIITDVYTLLSLAVPNRNRRVPILAKVLEGARFLYLAIPQWIHSDQGRNFESALISILCRVYVIAKSRTTYWAAPGNGQCQRFNGTLYDLNRLLLVYKERRWSKRLLVLLMIYNTITHAFTSCSPYYLMCGQESELPIDCI